MSARTLACSHMVSSVMKLLLIQATRDEYSLSESNSASTRAMNASASFAVGVGATSSASAPQARNKSAVTNAVVAISGRVVMEASVQIGEARTIPEQGAWVKQVVRASDARSPTPSLMAKRFSHLFVRISTDRDHPCGIWATIYCRTT